MDTVLLTTFLVYVAYQVIRGCYLALAFKQHKVKTESGYFANALDKQVEGANQQIDEDSETREQPEEHSTEGEEERVWREREWEADWSKEEIATWDGSPCQEQRMWIVEKIEPDLMQETQRSEFELVAKVLQKEQDIWNAGG